MAQTASMPMTDRAGSDTTKSPPRSAPLGATGYLGPQLLDSHQTTGDQGRGPRPAIRDNLRKIKPSGLVGDTRPRHVQWHDDPVEQLGIDPRAQRGLSQGQILVHRQVGDRRGLVVADHR